MRRPARATDNEWDEAAQHAVRGRYGEDQRRKDVKSRTVTGGSDYR